MRREFRKPLIIMTPKSLLRHKKCISNISEFSIKSTFHRVLEDDSFIKIKNLLELKKKAIKNSNKIQVLYLDQTVKSSRSIDLVNYFIKKRGINNIYFIIGSDILLELHKWKSWKKLIKLTKLIVFSRKGYDKKSKNSIVAKYLKNRNIIYIKNKPIVVSSTLIRKNLIKIN